MAHQMSRSCRGFLEIGRDRLTLFHVLAARWGMRDSCIGFGWDCGAMRHLLHGHEPTGQVAVQASQGQPGKDTGMRLG